MKSVLLKCLVLILFFQSFAFTFNGPPDFHPRQLDREIRKIYHTDHFQIAYYPSSENQPDSNTGKYFSIYTGNTLAGYGYIGRVMSCRQGMCFSNLKNSKSSFAEYFDYFILFDSTISIQKVMVFNYMASHGNEITSNGWLKQFIGYNGNNSLIAGKDIDAISGATVSVHGLINDVIIRTSAIKKLKSEKKNF
ncbi:MAG TPA: FMN-binding protein [Bacteroidia bacterium]|nr:FMN-binding protein [Bacteroidia bacterium]HRS57635.1 FMN-binding protein [Bacteroidia bacterium]HRU68922.1 FMN-binding protein [Bacteroidia bacterium]